MSRRTDADTAALRARMVREHIEARGILDPALLEAMRRVPREAFLPLYFVGYASIATLSAPLVAAVIFAYRYLIGAGPWEYILYGVLAEILLAIALRPNIKPLLNGTERVVGLRARRNKPQPRGTDGQCAR